MSLKKFYPLIVIVSIAINIFGVQQQSAFSKVGTLTTVFVQNDALNNWWHAYNSDETIDNTTDLFIKNCAFDKPDDLRKFLMEFSSYELLTQQRFIVDALEKIFVLQGKNLMELCVQFLEKNNRAGFDKANNLLLPVPKFEEAQKLLDALADERSDNQYYIVRAYIQPYTKAENPYCRIHTQVRQIPSWERTTPTLRFNISLYERIATDTYN